MTSFALGALLPACRKEEPAAQHTVRVTQQPSTRAAQSDSALSSYLAWHRDRVLLANRHMAELDAAMPAIKAKYSFRDMNKIAQDPDLLALVERQRSEMQSQTAHPPLGMTAEALDATLPGIGVFLLGTSRITYVPGRNEATLAAARAKYGDVFVSWVLAHERMIVATLGSAYP